MRSTTRVGMPVVCKIALASILFGLPQAFAHRPYEIAAGSFVRRDGVTVSAVKHFVDGILGADPVSVQFRRPNGTIIIQTDRTRDNVVVRYGAGNASIYIFPSDWIPVARSVQRFDGFSLTDITSPQERLFSPMVHTRANLGPYAVVMVGAVLVIAFWFLSKSATKHGERALRILAYIALVLVTTVYGLLVLVLPVSPFVVGLLGGVGVAIRFAMRGLMDTQKPPDRAQEC